MYTHTYVRMYVFEVRTYLFCACYVHRECVFTYCTYVETKVPAVSKVEGD